jgi:DNA-binding SARP family transcriptional activator
LHRLRAHLRRDDAVVRDGDGYRLHPDANVDLWEIERTMAAVRTREGLSETDRITLRRIWESLRLARPSRMEPWEWFAPVERRLGEFRIEIGHRLAIDALARNSPHEAIGFAEDMIAYDSCDEPARDVAIRAHLALNDRAAAMRQYRQYRETLLAELQCEPSAALRALVGL